MKNSRKEFSLARGGVECWFGLSRPYHRLNNNYYKAKSTLNKLSLSSLTQFYWTGFNRWKFSRITGNKEVKQRCVSLALWPLQQIIQCGRRTRSLEYIFLATIRKVQSPVFLVHYTVHDWLHKPWHVRLILLLVKINILMSTRVYLRKYLTGSRPYWCKKNIKVYFRYTSLVYGTSGGRYTTYYRENSMFSRQGFKKFSKGPISLGAFGLYLKNIISISGVIYS